MKHLAPLFLALAASTAFAQPAKDIRLDAKLIQSLLTVDFGHVTPEELEQRLITLPGVRTERGNILIDPKNPRHNITEIINLNGRVIDLTRSMGGDMGGGGKI